MGKVAVVVGATGNIGTAVTRELLYCGYDVIGTYRKQKNHALLIWSRGSSRIVAWELDVTNREQVQDIARSAAHSFGEVSAWVNCFGIIHRKPFKDITDGDWSHVMNVNLRGTFICCQEALPIMVKGGVIINIASSGGQLGGTQAVHYAVSKAGVIALTKSLARIAAPNVRVNCVSPGLIDSDMSRAEIESEFGQDKIAHDIPLGRPGTLEEVANAVMMCVNNTYMTGQVINVNGGLYMG